MPSPTSVVLPSVVLAITLAACTTEEPLAVESLALAGDLDPSFGPGGVVVTAMDRSAPAHGTAVRRQPDGKLAIAGEAWNGVRNVGIVGRLNVDGLIDSSFSQRGWVALDLGNSELEVSFFDLAVQADGKLVAVGRASNTSGSQSWAVIARYQADGTIDQGFGDGGIRLVAAPSYSFDAHAVALQSDGRIVTAGSRWGSAGSDALVIRLTATGALDTTLQGTGWRAVHFGTSEEARDVALQADGKILIGGTSSGTHSGGNYSDMFAARLNVSGALDAGFSGDGIALAVINDKETTSGMTVQADGKIVLVGHTFAATAITSDVAVARFLPGGALDTSFSGDGKLSVAAEVAADGATAVVATASGQLLLAGHATRSNGRTDFLFVRLGSDGGLDPGFDGDGIRFASFASGAAAYGLALQPDGRAVAVGNRFDSDDTRIAAMRVNTSGALDANFDVDGRATLSLGGGADRAYASAVQPDGKLVLAGQTHTGFFHQCLVLRYTTSGALDASFSGDGKVVFSFAPGDTCSLRSVALQADGRVLVSDGFRLARLTTTGALDTSFSGDGLVTLAIAEDTGRSGDLAVLASGKIMVGGSIRQLGTYRLGLAQLHPDGSLDTSYSGDGWTTFSFSGADHSIHRIVPMADGRVLALGRAADLGPLVTRFLATGAVEGNFGNGGRTVLEVGAFSDSPASLLLLPDGKIMVVSNAMDGLVLARTILWRLNQNGSFDTSFDGDGWRALQPVAYTVASDMLRQSDGKLILAGRAVDPSTGRAGCLVARVSAAGVFDTSYSGDGWTTHQPGFGCTATAARFVPGSSAVYLAGYDTFTPFEGSGLDRGDDTPWDVVALKVQP